MQTPTLAAIAIILAGSACADVGTETDAVTEDLASAPVLPAEYRGQTYTVELPLVLEYAFGGAASNRARLNVVNYPNGASDLFFFHMHANEKTAKHAGEEAVRANGGTFMYLSHASEERDMVVSIGGRRYTFDPNRIFTATGLEQKTEPRPTGNDLAELRRFVDWVESNISIARSHRARPMVIALHNNTDDDTEGRLLSILTEKDLLNVDNKLVNVNATWDIDNFYIATLPTTYDAMIQGLHPNISLRLEHPRDIGYLSNWMINTAVDYLNVETQHGDDAGNRRMVESLQTLLR
jgi:hypothetical protein